jgi:hypothetical protein
MLSIVFKEFLRSDLENCSNLKVQRDYFKAMEEVMERAF